MSDQETISAPSAVSAEPTGKFHRKQAAILGAAARLFNRDGLKGATLAEVAANVGLLTHSLGYYYRRKEDLAAACLMRSIETVTAIARSAQSAGGPAAGVRAYLRGYAALAAEVASGRRDELVYFDDILALPAPQNEAVFAAYNDMFRAIRALLPAGVARSAAAARDAVERARQSRNARAHLLVSIGNAMSRWLLRFQPQDFPRVADQVADIVLDGLAGPRLQWPALAYPQSDALHPQAQDRAVPEAFLRAATLLVNEQGYQGASVERISARLNLTKGAFYHHHASKDALIIACFERTIALVSAMQVQAAQHPGRAGERLAAIVGRLIRFQLAEQGPLLRNTAYSALPAGLRGDLRQRFGYLIDRFGFMVVDGMRAGDLQPVDAAIAARLVSDLINAASELPRWVPGIHQDNAVALYAQPLFFGLLADQPSD
jgi:AcrR family transcriptional regulator